MIFSYKTRQFFRRALRTLLVLALILAISLLFFAVWLRRFVVYTPQGVRLDFNATVPVGPGAVPSRPDKLDIFIDYWQPEETRPDDPVIVQQRLEGYYVPSEMLQKNIPALREQLALLPAGTAVLLDLKSFWGYFYYSSDFGIHSDSYDIGAVDALIADLAAFDLHLIARLPALRDYEYARNHTSCGLPTSKGYLWTDDSGCYWLDPTDDGTLTHLINVAKELRDMGFDEVVFKDFYVPESNKIVFRSDRKAAIEAAAATLVAAFPSGDFTVSFVGYRTDLVLPEGNCRLYLEGVAAVDVQDVLAMTQVADKRMQVVLLCQTNDTRYDVCGTLRPLDLAH